MSRKDPAEELRKKWGIAQEKGQPGNPMLEAVKRIGSHPVTPIVLGVLVTLDTPGNVRVKSWAFLVLWIWIVIDVGIYIKERGWRSEWKRIIFCFASSITAMAMLYGVLYFVRTDLYQRQKDAFSHLTANAYLPPNLDPLRTVFTLSNGSGVAISPANHLMCLVNVLVGASGVPHLQAGVQSVAWNSGPPIAPGGDASSSECFHTIVGVEGGTTCIDVTLVISYSIDDQPESSSAKAFRFVGNKRAGFYSWYKEAIGTPYDYCEAYINDKDKPVNRPRIPYQSHFE